MPAVELMHIDAQRFFSAHRPAPRRHAEQRGAAQGSQTERGTSATRKYPEMATFLEASPLRPHDLRFR
jgi:hypothetical protein